MHLKFLCTTHRDWVYFHPQEAVQKLAQAANYGVVLLEHGKWREALRFIGSAYETSEILLELGQTRLYTLFTNLGLQLGQCLERLDCREHAIKVLQQTESMLRQQLEISTGGQEQSILHYCLFEICSNKTADNDTQFFPHRQVHKRVH